MFNNRYPGVVDELTEIILSITLNLEIVFIAETINTKYDSETPVIGATDFSYITFDGEVFGMIKWNI